MKVTFDDNGYVSGWCVVGDNGGEDYDPPEDFDNFLLRWAAFKKEDGRLVFDQTKDEADKLAQEQTSLRERREKECFPIINRGWIWYSCLNLSQWRELRTWYLAWLDVTKTGKVPEKPSWIDNIDTSRIPLTPMGIL